MTDVQLVDVSIRDGNQSLWGAVGLRTEHILTMATLLGRAGFRTLDFSSSTAMGVAVRNHRQDPWERIRLVRKLIPDTRLQFIGTGLRFISWDIAHPEFMQLAYDRLVDAGIDRVVVLEPMHELPAMLRTARMCKQAGVAEVIGALTYTISDVHDDAFYAGLAASMAQCPDIDRAYLKDPAGILSPERARTLIPAIQAALGGKPLELHSHCTIGLSQFSYLVAADLGVQHLQVGCGALSDGSSLPDAQQLVANLRAAGHTVDIDDRALGLVADFVNELARAEGLPIGAPSGYDVAFTRHQVAGGVMSTTRRQLAEIGHEDRFDEVIEEVDRVRTELGSPIMVTPFPQMVCSQALFNVIGRERYDTVADQVIRYALGTFGKPPAPIEPWVLDRILGRPRAEDLRREPPPPTPAELRRRFGDRISDEELLLRATMPADQVDAMLTAGPAPRHYDPAMYAVTGLVRRLAERPALGDVAVSTSDTDLRLRSGLVAKGADHG